METLVTKTGSGPDLACGLVCGPLLQGYFCKRWASASSRMGLRSGHKSGKRISLGSNSPTDWIQKVLGDIHKAFALFYIFIYLFFK